MSMSEPDPEHYFNKIFFIILWWFLKKSLSKTSITKLLISYKVQLTLFKGQHRVVDFPMSCDTDGGGHIVQKPERSKDVLG